MAEREEQKRKTRADLLAGARSLLQGGKSVTVTAAARAAGISKATAYRYYSDPALLAAEAGLDFQAKSQDLILEGCTTLTERLVAVSLYFFDLAIANEAAFRTYLGLFLQASASGSQDGPERGGRRLEAYRKVLQAEPGLKPDDVERLAAALSVGTGPEAMVALVDVAKCSREQARALVRDIAEAIIARMLPQMAVR